MEIEMRLKNVRRLNPLSMGISGGIKVAIPLIQNTHILRASERGRAEDGGCGDERKMND
jgi:hypothetical protein